jgi:hypothetical protein
VEGLWWRLAICGGVEGRWLEEMACDVVGGVRWVLGLASIR